jgi:hypothetical protein
VRELNVIHLGIFRGHESGSLSARALGAKVSNTHLAGGFQLRGA